MRKTIVVDVDSANWPEIECTSLIVTSMTEDALFDLFRNAEPQSRAIRAHQYDICYPQFEVQLTNALRLVVSQIISKEREDRKNGQASSKSSESPQGNGEAPHRSEGDGRTRSRGRSPKGRPQGKAKGKVVRRGH